MDASSKKLNEYPDRSLRIITIVAIVPAFALLIPSGVVTAGALPAIGLVPMAMSLVVSMAALTSKKPNVRSSPKADMIVVLSLLAVMIPSWIYLATTWRLSRADGMLCSYGMMPMMVNLCIHAYLVLRNFPSFLRPRSCPNCNHAEPSIFPRWQRHVALPANTADEQVQADGPGHSRSHKDIYQPFMNAYAGEDARESSEFQTSGFNTPRQSAETLRSEVRPSEEGTARVDVKDADSLV